MTRETLFGRRFWRLAAIAAALLVLTAATGRPGPLAAPAAWLNEVVSPVEVTVAAGVRGLGAVWRGVGELWSLRAQNARLRAEVGALRAQAQNSAEITAENRHLTALLNLQASALAAGVGQGIAARVIGHGANDWWSALVLDRGSRAGVRAGMVVASPYGNLVGRVAVGVGPTTAQVTLLTNPDFGVGVRVERGASRAAGVARGQVGSHALTVTFFSGTADVRVGDVLVTSGISSPGVPGAFPPGLTVGTVTEVTPGGAGLVRKGLITPSADLDALGHVLLLPPPGGGAPG